VDRDETRVTRLPIRIQTLAGLLALLALLTLGGCSREDVAPLPTPAAAAEVPDPTPVLPTPTELPPAPTVAPSPTPEPTPCSRVIQPALAPAYSEAELGCPIDAGQTPISTAYAPFAGGQMLWRGDADLIYALTNDNRWTIHANTWRDGEPAFSCGEETNPPTPVRGFGRVWCEEPGLAAALGVVTAAEIGDAAGTVQTFEQGTILVAPWGSLFVFKDDGTWRRVDVAEE
jgi:hypothetical protein